MIKTVAMRMWIVLLLAAGSTACGITSPDVSYYSLSSLVAHGDRASASPSVPSIGVGPVALPDYLDRPQLITRSGPNQLRVDEYYRWGGALKQEIVRVVTQNLMTLIGSDKIMPIPWPGDFNPDMTVRLEVYAFEGASDGSARLRTTVTLAYRNPGSTPLAWTVDLKEQATSRAPEEIVAAQSRLLAQLSRQIAEAIVRRTQVYAP